MAQPNPHLSRRDVHLRDVMEADLHIFFEHQRDPEANRLAAFPPREREAFMAHWAKVMADESVVKKTVVVDGQVAGNLVSFVLGGQREVGYWIGREYWGRGVATRALSEFIGHVQARPVYGRVAKHNLASRRVLEKCGFRLIGEDKEFSITGGDHVEGLVFELSAEAG